MSAHVWKAGDLAVLVIEGEAECPHTLGGKHRGDALPPKGSVHRVEAIDEAIFDRGKSIGRKCGCLILNFSNGMTAATFRCRPILPAEPAFTEDMRSLKPRVEA